VSLSASAAWAAGSAGASDIAKIPNNVFTIRFQRFTLTTSVSLSTCSPQLRELTLGKPALQVKKQFSEESGEAAAWRGFLEFDHRLH